MSYSALPDLAVSCPDEVILTVSHDSDIELGIEHDLFSVDIVVSEEAAAELYEWLAVYFRNTREGGD